MNVCFHKYDFNIKNQFLDIILLYTICTKKENSNITDNKIYNILLMDKLA